MLINQYTGCVKWLSLHNVFLLNPTVIEDTTEVMIHNIWNGKTQRGRFRGTVNGTITLRVFNMCWMNEWINEWMNE